MTPHSFVAMYVCIGGTYYIILQDVDSSALQIVAGRPVKHQYCLPNVDCQFVHQGHLYKGVNILIQWANMPLVHKYQILL